MIFHIYSTDGQYFFSNANALGYTLQYVFSKGKIHLSFGHLAIKKLTFAHFHMFSIFSGKKKKIKKTETDEVGFQLNCF